MCAEKHVVNIYHIDINLDSNLMNSSDKSFIELAVISAVQFTIAVSISILMFDWFSHSPCTSMREVI